MARLAGFIGYGSSFPWGRPFPRYTRLQPQSTPDNLAGKQASDMPVSYAWRSIAPAWPRRRSNAVLRISSHAICQPRDTRSRDFFRMISVRSIARSCWILSGARPAIDGVLCVFNKAFNRLLSVVYVAYLCCILWLGRIVSGWKLWTARGAATCANGAGRGDRQFRSRRMNSRQCDVGQNRNFQSKGNL